MELFGLMPEALVALPNIWSLPVCVAYIDLGTGSMILQMVVAGLLSVAVTFKRLRMAVLAPLRRLLPRKGAGAPASPGKIDDPGSN